MRIRATPAGLKLDDEWFPEAVCLQVLSTWQCPADEIVMNGTGSYAMTNGVKGDIPQEYALLLKHCAARFVEFIRAKTALADAKAEARDYAGQSSLIRHAKVVAGQDGPSLMKFGNVWTRKWWLKQGEFIRGHTHNFDHLALLYRGSASVLVEQVQTTYIAPNEIIIRKDHEHSITALEDNTMWLCVFAVRDEAGEVDVFGASNDPMATI
jgi:hypothetical protein